MKFYTGLGIGRIPRNGLERKGRRNWVDLDVNGKTDLMEIEWEGVDWMQLAQDWNRWWVVVNVAA